MTGTVGTGAENLVPTGIRTPDRTVGSKSLYRLSYPSPIYHSDNCMNCLKNTDYDTHCIFKIIMQFEAPDSTVDTMTKLKPTIPKNMASILAQAKDLSLPQIVSDTGPYSKGTSNGLKRP